MAADEALFKFQEFRRNVEQYKEEFLSETDTRCKFIDKLFIDCLGWAESSIRREEHLEGGDGYVDYIFKTHSPILVVEAKRNSLFFDFPKDGKRKYKINGVISKNNDIQKAIEQARKYAEAKSIKYVIIANGIQLIAFVAVRTDGIPWKNGECIVFRDLDDIENNFTKFYNIFYKSLFIMHSLEKEIFVGETSSSGKRVINFIDKPDEPIYRNSFSDALNKVIEDYFSDIIDMKDNDVLESCYCTNSEIKIYENNLESLLKDNLPSQVSNVKKIVLKSSPKKEEFEKDLKSYADGGATKIPVLLIGNLGAGKSTFLRWFFDLKIDESVRKKTLPVFLDFLKGPSDEKKYIHYIQNKIINDLEAQEKYNLSQWNILNAIYRDLISKEEKGELAPIANKNYSEFECMISEKIKEWKKDTFNHIGRLVKYLAKHHGVRVVIVYDNADQKGREFEFKIYEHANMLTKEFGCLAIISLREDSYWQANRVGVFDAYHTHVYHLRAPRFKELLEKRLYFALSNIKKEKKEYFTSFGAFKVKIIDLQAFLEVIISSVLEHSKGIKILKFMECIACCNMRIALDMFKMFLTSGNTKVENYIRDYLSERGKYIIPFHEFARSVMLGDRKYYSEPRGKFVLDLFSIGKGSVVSPFTRLRILELLSKSQNISTAAGKGFYKKTDVIEKFLTMNYEAAYVVEHLNMLLKFNLIETDNSIRETVDDVEYVRITAGGEYFLTFLLEQIVYLDVISTDIIISDENVFQEILAIFKKENAKGRRSIVLRVEIIDKILSYLETIERNELEAMRELSDPIFTVKFTDRIRAEFNVKRDLILAHGVRS